MARGRIIDKEFFSHVELGELPLETRYFYQGLIVWADDQGRLKAQPRYLRAKIFPYDNMPEERLEQMVNQLATIGCVHVYQVGNEPFIQHPNWERWQPIRKDRYQPSDCPNPVDGQPFSFYGKPLVNQATTVGSPNLTLPNLTQPNRTADATFDHFWNNYPKKVAKPTALKAWAKLRPTEELLKKILEGLEAWKGTDQWHKDGGAFIPHPTTWLNQRRWEDQLPTEKQEVPSWEIATPKRP